jgi:predicted phage terminase large subunit-like protein
VGLFLETIEPERGSRKSQTERRKAKLQLLRDVKTASDRELRRLIIEEDRVDVLAEMVGLWNHSFHDAIGDFQDAHTQTIQLGPRGWGKSVRGTELKVAHSIIKNRDIRALVVSSSADRAHDFLTAIKQILEHRRVVEVFGEFRSDKKWAETSISVSGRTTLHKEPTVSTSGIGSSVTSGHFDLIIADDLVTFKNSRTQVLRDGVKSWFRITLVPCIVDETTEFHILGTRYHPDDLYGELLKNPMFEVQIVPALTMDGETNYPERFSTEFLKKWKITMGQVAWESQMMQDPSSLQGSVFHAGFFRHVDEHPAEHFYTFTGIDLAIGRESHHDQFAWVTVGVSATERRKIYVLDYYTSRKSLAEQDEEIYANWVKFRPLITGIESNHFQAAKCQRLREHPKYNVVNAVPIQTSKDKDTRAQLLSIRFERGEIVFMKALKGSELEAQLLGFPNHRFKDLFDALDMAVRIVNFRRGKKRTRKREPGLIRVNSPFRR